MGGETLPSAAAACRLPPAAPSPASCMPSLLFRPLQWVDAMELSSLTPQLPALLAEMGVQYDPEKLASVLSSRPTGALAAEEGGGGGLQLAACVPRGCGMRVAWLPWLRACTWLARVHGLHTPPHHAVPFLLPLLPQSWRDGR